MLKKIAILIAFFVVSIFGQQALPSTQVIQSQAAAYGFSPSDVASVMKQVESKQESSSTQETSDDVLQEKTEPNVTNQDKSNSVNSRIEEMYALFESSDQELIEDSDLKSNEKQLLEFQNEVASKQFGYDIFQRKFSIRFDDIPVNSDYILGPGDSLVIYVWGLLEDQFNVTLDKEGSVYLPKVGRVQLSGVRFGDVESVIKSNLSKYFTNFKVSVAIGKIRSMKIFVLGDVKSPGEYHVSSLSSVFQTLYLAGGPTKMGTLRSVKVLRSNKTIESIDLYEYFVGGKNNLQITLNDLDTIFIPPIGAVAKISGMVKRPSIYELSSTSSVYDLIQLSGGLTAGTYFNRVQIKRIVKGEEQTIVDEYFKDEKSLKTRLKLVPLQDGDWVQILPISTVVRNYVTISGNVARPGQYELLSDMTLNDLFKSSQGILNGTYGKRIEVYRFVSPYQREIIPVSVEKSSEFKLKEWDKVKVYSEHDVIGSQVVYSEGAFTEPKRINLYQNMTVSDLVFKSKPTVYAQIDKAELIRQDESGNRKILYLDLTDIFTNPNSVSNLILKPNDRLVLREASNELKQHTITVKGEVKFPGEYVYEPGDRLSDVLNRAGGITERAFFKGLIFTRLSTKAQAISGHRTLVKREESNFIYEKSKISPIADSDSAALIQYEVAAQAQVLGMLKDQIKDYTGRVVLTAGSLYNLQENGDDLELEDGDSIYIPPTPSTIQVIGGVQSPSAIKYVEGKDVYYYIDLLGGFSAHADKKQLTILKPNGIVSNNLSLVEQGDLIYVPDKFKVPITWGYVLKYVGNVLTSVSKVVLPYLVIDSAINN